MRNKKALIATLMICIIFAFYATLSASAQQQPVRVFVFPVETSVAPSSTFWIYVCMAGTEVKLSEYNVSLSYDPNLLLRLDVKGGWFDAIGFGWTESEPPGIISAWQKGWQPFAKGGALFWVQFHCIQPGVCELVPSVNVLKDDAGNPIPSVTENGRVSQLFVTWVGGPELPVEKFGLLAPYVALGMAVVAITVGTIYARKRWLGKSVLQRP